MTPGRRTASSGVRNQGSDNDRGHAGAPPGSAGGTIAAVLCGRPPRRPAHPFTTPDRGTEQQRHLREGTIMTASPLPSHPVTSGAPWSLWRLLLLAAALA